MTDGQARALTRALAYIIKKSVPAEKTEAGKQERMEILEGLLNAGRPSRADPSRQGDNEQNEQPSQPAFAAQSNGPDVLHLDMVMPTDQAPRQVRANTVFGNPKDIRVEENDRA